MAEYDKQLNEEQLIFRAVDRIVKNSGKNFDDETEIDKKTWALQLDISTRFLESLVKSILEDENVESIQDAYKSVIEEEQEYNAETGERSLPATGRMKAAQKRFEKVLEALHKKNKFFTHNQELVIENNYTGDSE